MTSRFAAIENALDPWRPFRYDVAGALREPNWVVKDLLAESEILLLSGDSSAGKSFLAYALAFAVLDGGQTWLGQPVAGPGRVLIVDGEMSPYRVEKRLRGFGLREEHWDRLVYLDKSQAVALDDPAQIERLSGAIGVLQPGLVILDSVFSLASAIDHNSNGAVSDFYRTALRPLVAPTAMVALHHENKPGERGRGRAEYAATGARAWAHQADMHLALAAKGNKEVTRETLPDGHSRSTYAVELDSGKARDVLKPRLDLAIVTEEDQTGQVISTQISVLGERKRRQKSDKREQIIAAVTGGPLRRKPLAEACGGEGGSFDRALADLREEGLVVKEGELYKLA
jgi:hypothetical protein